MERGRQDWGGLSFVELELYRTMQFWLRSGSENKASIQFYIEKTMNVITVEYQTANSVYLWFKGLGVGGDGFFCFSKIRHAAGFHSELWINDMRGGGQQCSDSVQYVSSDTSRCAVA